MSIVCSARLVAYCELIGGAFVDSFVSSDNKLFAPLFADDINFTESVHYDDVPSRLK